LLTGKCIKAFILYNTLLEDIGDVVGECTVGGGVGRGDNAVGDTDVGYDITLAVVGQWRDCCCKMLCCRICGWRRHCK